MMSKKLPRMLALVGLVTLTMPPASAVGDKPKDAEFEAANIRIQPLARVKLAPASTEGAAIGNRTGEELYKAVCGACHDAGVAGAPKTGDKAAWAPRIGVGLSVLTKTAIAGKGAMPPKGGADATDEELARAIVFMANKSGASFKEPVAGKIAGGERSAASIIKSACLKCHETGDKSAKDAPKLSDKAAWTQRLSKGLDAVTETVIRGHGDMPARGGLAELTDVELRGAIAEIFKRVGANKN